MRLEKLENGLIRQADISGWSFVGVVFDRKIERSLDPSDTKVLDRAAAILGHLEQTRGRIVIGHQLESGLAGIDDPVHAAHRHMVSGVNEFLTV